MEKETVKAPTTAAVAESTAPVAEVVVTENAPVSSTASVVPSVAAQPVVAKTRLFWQKACGSIKESTNTEIKANEVFVRTSHVVNVLPEGATEPVQNLIYSLKRGKRIYYTPSSYLSPAQLEAANAASDLKAKEKEAADKKKADEKKAKEEAKTAAAAGQPKVVGGPAVVAPAPAPAATAETVAEVTEEAMA